MRDIVQLGGILFLVILTNLVNFGCRLSLQPFAELIATPTPSEAPDVWLEP